MPRLILVLLLLIFSSSPAFSAVQPPERSNMELGVTRLKANYPAPGSAIDNPRPIITVDFSRLETPVDTTTVAVFLNRIDVTEGAEITPAYALYTPPADLAPGDYEVRVAASGIDKNPIQPLTWNFRITEAALKKAPPRKISRESGTTVGSFQMSTDYVTASYARQPFFYVPQLFEEREGMKVNADLNFSNNSGGRTILGYFHRDTIPYSGISENKLRLNYYDSKFSATLGHFWFRQSELTVAGAEMAGMKIDTSTHRWDLSLFGGRSQDPRLSGDYRQMAYGARSAFKWGARNISSLTIIAARENDDMLQPRFAAGLEPANDDIIAFRHEYKPGGGFAAELEMAGNTHKEPGGGQKYHDSASRLQLTEELKTFRGEAELYSIGSHYFPIADGSNKYLNNDRRGLRIKGHWRFIPAMAAGAEYEQYETPSTGLDTKHVSGFVAVSAGALQALTLNKDKLTVGDGIVSETGGVTAVIAAARLGPFHDTNLTVGWQDIKYAAATIDSEAKVKLLAFNTSILGVVGLSFGYSVSDGVSSTPVVAQAQAKNRNLSFGLDWKIYSRLNLGWRYETITNSGFNTSSREKRFKTSLGYMLDDSYSLNVGFDRINYSDGVTPGNGYSQKIARTGFAMSF